VGEVQFKNQRANYPNIRIDCKKGLKFENGTDYNMRDIVYFVSIDKEMKLLVGPQDYQIIK
tara:strand:+ start:446 stop:628 length:183 start_codon:yes stop_codon:yes gene_type:complete